MVLKSCTNSGMKPDSLHGWDGILINCARQHLNQLKKKNQVSIEALGSADLESLQEETSIPDNNQEVSKNLKRALESAIGHLPSKYRVVFILREIEDISVADTASMLEITEDNVKIRLHRAKNMLKNMLRAEATSLDIFALHATRCALIAARVMGHINSRMIYPFGNIPRDPLSP